VRIISADALAKLVTLKESTEIASVAKIHELLTPFEYTRLDKIIEIAFTVAEEASESAEERHVELETSSVAATSSSGKQRHSAVDVIEQVRSEIVATLSNQYSPLVKKSRALYWSTDKSIRAAVTISKQYENGNFWYAHHPAWDTFLAEASVGLLVLGCIGLTEAYAIPYAWIHSRLKYLNTTDRESGGYWHVYLHPESDGQLLLRLKNGQGESLKQFKLLLSARASASG